MDRSTTPENDPANDDVQRAADGDRSALDALLGRCQGRLRGIAHRLMGPRLRARLSVSDIVQSCYVEIIRGIRRLRDSGDGAFEAWSRRLLVNSVRRRSRHFSAEKRAETRDDLAADEEPAADGPSPSRAAVNAESLVRLQAAMGRLSAAHREIIHLRIIEGRRHDEIAEILDKSPTAVRMTLSRARARLSLALAKGGGRSRVDEATEWW